MIDGVFNGFNLVLRDSDVHCVTIGLLVLGAGVRKGSSFSATFHFSISFSICNFSFGEMDTLPSVVVDISHDCCVGIKDAIAITLLHFLDFRVPLSEYLSQSTSLRVPLSEYLSQSTSLRVPLSE